MEPLRFHYPRTAHIVVAGVALEFALDFGAGAVTVILARRVGDWVYVAASVVVVGSLPVLGLNMLVLRVANGDGTAFTGDDHGYSRVIRRAASVVARLSGTRTMPCRV